MKESRFDFFAQLTHDEKLGLESKDFMTSEIEEIISETPLCDLDKRISVYRYIKCMTENEIADKENVDIKTIHRRLQTISLKLKITCSRLFVK
jgi:DNA-directed RNA polymerase specialized sigma24 family protein